MQPATADQQFTTAVLLLLTLLLAQEPQSKSVQLHPDVPTVKLCLADALLSPLKLAVGCCFSSCFCCSYWAEALKPPILLPLHLAAAGLGLVPPHGKGRDAHTSGNNANNPSTNLPLTSRPLHRENATGRTMVSAKMCWFNALLTGRGGACRGLITKSLMQLLNYGWMRSHDCHWHGMLVVTTLLCSIVLKLLQWTGWRLSCSSRSHARTDHGPQP